MKTLIAAVLVAMLISTQAFAWSRDFKFRNNTTKSVAYLSLKSTHDKTWMVTRSSSVDPAADIIIKFDGQGPCMLNLRVTFVDKSREVAIFENLNFCNLNNVILQENSDGSVYVDWNKDAVQNTTPGNNDSLDADRAR